MFKVLGSTVALAVFALPLIPQAAFSQQATSPLNPAVNNSTGLNNIGSQGSTNLGADTTRAAGGASGTTNNTAATTTINLGGVLNLSTAASDRPTSRTINGGASVRSIGAENNQATGTLENVRGGNTNNVLNNVQPANSGNRDRAANQGANQNTQNNQAFVVRGTLDAPLQQAVCAQNWQQAKFIVNRAIAAAPVLATQYRSQLEAYRDQLQTLDAANVRVPNWQQQCGG